ncbi:MAG TPA: aspartate--tRNA(Asn) ligase, partial [Candidatus Saccharimonadales bacterium]|nr:aspartate--tRNA(Asn) ligase [Candidatus Saccharimonadales bacterium]
PEQNSRFDYRWLDLRRPEKLKIFKLWTELEKGARKYFNANDYLQIYVPALTADPSESGADVFEVKYFDHKAYLAQSPQFYKQMAIASGFEKVFAVGPVFRAEPSYTTRHMTEFTGFDFEFSYIDSHLDVMDELEKVVVAMFTQLKEAGFEVEVPSRPFPRLTIKEIKAKLGAQASDRPYDINAEEERALAELIKKETGHDFVFATDWPYQQRAFYHMRYEDKPELTKGFDLIYKGLEITTGAQREHRYDILVKQAQEMGVNVASLKMDAIKNYLDFFKYGCPPHGGAGIGPGRIIMKILDLPSVKEATFLPRDVKRLTP